MSVAQVRKTVVAVIGTAATLAVLIPEDLIPETWRPWVGILVGVATVLGVYRVRNDQPAATRVEPPVSRRS